MKIKKGMLAGLIAIMMSLSFVACGNEDKETMGRSTEPMTDNTETSEETEQTKESEPSEESEESKETEESEETEESKESEESKETESSEESEADGSSEEGSDQQTGEESSEGSSAFEVPVQEDFTPVEGLSDMYVDLDNRSFAYNGKVFTLGESTLKDLIDGGIPFDESDLNNKGNNLNRNYETSRYSATINDYVFMQFTFINITDGNMTEEECPLSSVRICFIYLPQPQYEAERNATITENILDAGNSVCFAFPLTLTKEQLLANSSEGAEQDDYNHVNYYIKSEVYMGRSGYHFNFDKNTDQMKEATISWLP